MNVMSEMWKKIKMLSTRMPELAGGFFIVLIIVLVVFGIQSVLRTGPVAVPSDGSLSFDRGRDGLSVSIGDRGFGMRFPDSLEKPVEVRLPGELGVRIVEQSSDSPSILLSEKIPKTDTNGLLLGILSRDPIFAAYRTQDGRKSDLYTYQEAVTGGPGNVKHWILYESGDGKEIASYRFEGASIRISDQGDAQVFASGKDMTGQPDFVVPRPYFLDREGKRTVLNWNFDERTSVLFVSFSVPKGHYPIALDPTVQFDADIATIHGYFKSHGAVSFSGKKISLGDYLFDRYAGAEVALSLRLLDREYEDEAIRVRRDSDDAEQDFGFDGSGLLDIDAIETWLGSSDGFVTTWYGQDSTGYDAVQATEANQPQIAESGTVIVDEDGVPVIAFDGTDDYMTISSLTLQTYFSLFVRGIPGDYIITEHGPDANGNPGFYFTNDAQYWFINRGSGYYGWNTAFTQYPKTVSGVMGLISRSDAAQHYYDGEAQPVSYSGSQLADSTATDTLYISSRAGTGLYSANRLSEFVIWDGTDQTSEIVGLNDNMTDAWPPLAVSPDFFAFTDREGVDVDTLTTSDIVAITGADNLPVSITGDGAPAYRICSDASCNTVVHDWTAGERSIDDGEYLQLRLTSAGSFEEIRAATVTVGGASNAWDVMTKEHLSEVLQGSVNYGWGLAKLNEDYSGPAIRVERSSDSAQQDIGFNADGSLDIASLLSFVGSGDGYVTTMYEQFGSAYDMDMYNDPLIVDSGTVVTHSDGSPAINIDGTTQGGIIEDIPLYLFTSAHARLEINVGDPSIIFEHSVTPWVDGSQMHTAGMAWARNGYDYISLDDTSVSDDLTIMSGVITATTGSTWDGMSTIGSTSGFTSPPNTQSIHDLHIFARDVGGYPEYPTSGKLSALVISDNYDNTSNLSDIVGYMMDNWPGAGTADPFGFADDSGIGLNTLTESSIVEITGSDAMPVSVSGEGSPAYRICSDSLCNTVAHDWNSSYGSIGNGEYLQLRLTSSASYRTTRTAMVRVGGQSHEWAVMTGGYLSQIITAPSNYAWALAQVNVGYSGPAIRVERSSDSVQQDIGFNADGSLDTASLLSFVGSGDGRVVRIYEQFESDYDMVLSNDPLIVDGGTVVTHSDGSPAIDFNPAGDAEQSGYVTDLPLYADMSLHFRVEVDVPTSGNVMLLEHNEFGFDDPGFYLNQEEWVHTRNGGYIQMQGGDILDDTLTVHSLIHRQSDGGSRYEGTTLLANTNNPRNDTLGVQNLYVFARQNTIENASGKFSALFISDDYDNTSDLSEIVQYMTVDWPD